MCCFLFTALDFLCSNNMTVAKVIKFLYLKHVWFCVKLLICSLQYEEEVQTGNGIFNLKWYKSWRTVAGYSTQYVDLGCSDTQALVVQAKLAGAQRVELVRG